MKPNVLILFAALICTSCAGPVPTPRDADVSAALSLPEYADMVERGEAVLIDVREENEIRAGMAEPALWVPTSLIQREDRLWIDMIDQFKKEPEKPVLLYCRSGRRSGIAARALSNLSIEAYNLGGFNEWVDAGLPTKEPESPVPGR